MNVANGVYYSDKINEIKDFINNVYGGAVTTPQQVYLLLGKFNLRTIDLVDLGIGDDLIKVALAIVVTHNPSQNKTVSYDELLIPEQYHDVYKAILQYQEYAKQAKIAEDALLEAVGEDDTVLDQILATLS